MVPIYPYVALEFDIDGPIPASWMPHRLVYSDANTVYIEQLRLDRMGNPSWVDISGYGNVAKAVYEATLAKLG